MAKKHNDIKILHIVLEIIVIVGYLHGQFLLGYLFAFWYVIPLTAINLLLSIIDSPHTIKYDGLNLIMAILALIPLIGSIPRLIGAILAIYTIIKLK